jgi:hypothetical protein
MARVACCSTPAHLKRKLKAASNHSQEANHQQELTQRRILAYNGPTHSYVMSTRAGERRGWKAAQHKAAML